MMLWMYLVPALVVSNMLANLIAFYGAETGWSYYADDNVNGVLGLGMYNIHRGEMIAWAAVETAQLMALYFNWAGWMYGQWDMLPEEAKANWMETDEMDGEMKEEKVEETLFRYFYGI